MSKSNIIHHLYNDIGEVSIWDNTKTITSRNDVVQVYVHGVPMLRFTSEDAVRSACILANLIFHTNKEFAS